LGYIKDTNRLKIELSLQELNFQQKLISFRDELSALYQEIFPQFARPA
jgi:hypothetical protein